MKKKKKASEIHTFERLCELTSLVLENLSVLFPIPFDQSHALTMGCYIDSSPVMMRLAYDIHREPLVVYFTSSQHLLKKKQKKQRYISENNKK